MPTVRMPDGALVNMPDNPTPKQLAELELYLSPSAQTSAPAGGSTGTAPPAPEGAPQPSGVDIFKRRLGILARGAATGVTGTVGMMGDALNTGINAVAGTKLAMPSQLIQQGLTQLGMPQAQSGDERFAQTAAGMAGGLFDPAAAGIGTAIQGSKALGGGALYANPAPVTPPSPAMDTISRGQALGYKATPSEAGSSLTGRVLESASSPATLKAGARTANQNVTNAVLRREAGLGANAPLDRETLDAAIKDTYEQGYGPVAKIGNIPTDTSYKKALTDILNKYQGVSRSFPGAAKEDVAQLVDNFNVPQFHSEDAIAATKQLRSEASNAFANGNGNLGNAMRDMSQAIENNIENYLHSFGPTPGATNLLEGLRSARAQLAKQYTIRDALIPGAGGANASQIGAALRNGAPLTGDLKLVGELANAAPQLMTAPHAAPQIMTGPEGLAAASGLTTLLHGNPIGAVVAGVPIARAGTRQMLLSNAGQAMFSQPTLPAAQAAAGMPPWWLQAMPGGMAASGLFGP